MYSPKIREIFIPTLYRLSKHLKKPMTVVVNEIIGKELEKITLIQRSEAPTEKGGMSWD